MNIEWSPTAQADRQSIFIFLATENGSVRTASAIVDRIEARVAALAQFPRSGRVGKVAGTRELVVSGTPYIAVYQLRNGVVRILRVLHHAQLWPPRL